MPVGVFWVTPPTLLHPESNKSATQVSDTFEPFYDLLVEIPPGDALPEIRARLASPGKEGDADAETTGNGLAHASQAAPPPSASTSTSASSGGFGSGLLSTLGSWLWPTWLRLSGTGVVVVVVVGAFLCIFVLC